MYCFERFLIFKAPGLSSLFFKDIEIKKIGTKTKIATVTAVQPPGRFGALSLEKDFYVDGFKEKPQGDWVNGGFFVLNQDVFSLIENDETIWEKEPLITLTKRKELKAFFHKGFWHPMDTLRDKIYLESLLNNGKAPWIKW